ncbi:MAG: glycosyltransferase family 39 protein [Terriglobales bacterium]
MGKARKPERRTDKQPNAKKSVAGKYYAYAFLLLVIVFFAAIRFRLRTMPLERDEGEYAYGGQLMLEGVPPYKLAYTMKLPGTQAAYAAIIAVFGQTATGIHLGLLLVNAATTLLIYLLAARLSGRLGGVVAAASYAVLSTSFSVLGLAAHATHFVVMFAVAGILVLLGAMESGRLWQYFASGLLLGLAFLMKQPGIVFAAFGGLYILTREWPPPLQWKRLLSRIGCYGAGVLLPLVLTCLILLATGVFGNFRFWVFTYASQYTFEVGFARGVQELTHNFPKVVGSALGIWIIAGAGLVAFRWDRESRRHAVLIGGLLLFSFLGVCPGLYFRSHYFILMLPVVAVLAGMAVHSATQVLAKRGGIALAAIPVLVFSAVLGYAVVQQKAFLFDMDPVEACEKQYGSNPFPEALVVAQYLDAHTAANEPVAVLGSEPEIYFYAKRRSATGFIYVYGLMEQQKYSLEMQKEMIGEIEAARPQYLVIAKSPLSWLPQAGSPQALSMTEWIKNVLLDYELVGVAERVGKRTEYHWDDEARAYKTHSQNIVGVFRRKS